MLVIVDNCYLSYLVLGPLKLLLFLSNFYPFIGLNCQRVFAQGVNAQKFLMGRLCPGGICPLVHVLESSYFSTITYINIFLKPAVDFRTIFWPVTFFWVFSFDILKIWSPYDDSIIIITQCYQIDDTFNHILHSNRGTFEKKSNDERVLYAKNILHRIYYSV